jgi:hypothetical protein
MALLPTALLLTGHVQRLQRGNALIVAQRSSIRHGA